MKNDTAETLFPYFCIRVVSAAGECRSNLKSAVSFTSLTFSHVPHLSYIPVTPETAGLFNLLRALHSKSARNQSWNAEGRYYSLFPCETVHVALVIVIKLGLWTLVDPLPCLPSRWHTYTQLARRKYSQMRCRHPLYTPVRHFHPPVCCVRLCTLSLTLSPALNFCLERFSADTTGMFWGATVTAVRMTVSEHNLCDKCSDYLRSAHPSVSKWCTLARVQK